MWFNESVFYQIYTLNFCGAPRANDGIVEHRILRLNDFMDYFEDLGINAIYFNPVFSSDHHGYDTRDYCKIDERLGTNEDFIEICKNLHDRGMRVVLDGVFNHVGRGFFAFQDVLNNRENSQYKNWFRIDFNGTDFDEKVLSFCYYRARKVSEIAAYLGVRDSSYLRKKVLENLVQNGYLEKNKVSRAIYYKTKHESVYVR